MKRFLLSATVIFIFMSVMWPATGSAVEMSVGASTWYLWMKTEARDYETTTESTLMYGPALSAKFTDDFNLTFVFLYGKFKDITNSDNVDTLDVVTYDMKRYDSDLALNYRLNSYFKLFIGGKYMGYDYKVDGASGTFKHRSYGPGAGISAVFPISGNFFLIGNAGFLYLWGKQIEFNDEQTQDYMERGVNTSLSLAYYIEPASTTINLGGRYQYIRTKYEENTDCMDENHFYGITLSATYSFGI